MPCLPGKVIPAQFWYREKNLCFRCTAAWGIRFLAGLRKSAARRKTERFLCAGWMLRPTPDLGGSICLWGVSCRRQKIWIFCRPRQRFMQERIFCWLPEKKNTHCMGWSFWVIPMRPLRFCMPWVVTRAFSAHPAIHLLPCIGLWGRVFCPCRNTLVLHSTKKRLFVKNRRFTYSIIVPSGLKRGSSSR